MKNIHSADDESSVMVSAIVNSVMPKLTTSDYVVFENILAVNFAGARISEDLEDVFSKFIEAAAKTLALCFTPIFHQKAKQLHSALSQRMGVVMFGNSQTGKTSVWKALGVAISLHTPNTAIKLHVLSTKATSRYTLAITFAYI